MDFKKKIEYEGGWSEQAAAGLELKRAESGYVACDRASYIRLSNAWSGSHLIPVQKTDLECRVS